MVRPVPCRSDRAGALVVIGARLNGPSLATGSVAKAGSAAEFRFQCSLQRRSSASIRSASGGQLHIPPYIPCVEGWPGKSSAASIEFALPPPSGLRRATQAAGLQRRDPSGWHRCCCFRARSLTLVEHGLRLAGQLRISTRQGPCPASGCSAPRWSRTGRRGASNCSITSGEGGRHPPRPAGNSVVTAGAWPSIRHALSDRFAQPAHLLCARGGRLVAFVR